MTVHMQSVVIAVLLFIFGEKSVTVGKLSVHAFDQIFKDRTPREGAEFEVAMIALALGTAIAVLLACLRQKRDAEGDLTIFIGVLTASIAGLLNIGEAALDDTAKFGQYPQQAMFFYLLWLLVVILPSFGEVIRGNTVRIEILSRVMSALVFGAVLGFAWHMICGIIIRDVFQAPGATSLNDGLRHMGMRPAAVTALGAVFVAAAFTSFDGRSRPWVTFYALSAVLAGYTYGHFFYSGQPGPGVTKEMVNAGFAALCAAAFAPAVLFGRGLLLGEKSQLLWAVATWFVACALAMFAGLGQALGHPTGYNIQLSVMQGIAGGLVPVALWLSTITLNKFRSQRLRSRAEQA